MNVILLAALIILILVWIEERSYYIAHKKVKEMWSSGDRSCSVRKKWYGWTVITNQEAA